MTWLGLVLLILWFLLIWLHYNKNNSKASNIYRIDLWGEPRKGSRNDWLK